MSLPPRIAGIIAQVAVEHGVSVKDILGPSRVRKITRARQEAMRTVRSLERDDGTVPSLPQIGRWFGRDHSTVSHACQGLVPLQTELELAA